ncbi:hypothetical protein CEE39_10115 [bacterium (candidate division B38) B3_B38]|nr:MAG: hypothetical protein CEE39_10115 [bacterium (candidate division B38) B3_B38]
MVGDEVGFSVSLPQPAPPGVDILKSAVFTIYVEVPDTERAERFLTRLFAATPLLIREEEYGGQPIWLLTSEGEIMFAHAFKRHFLIMSTNQQWLKQVLSVERKTLAASVDFVRGNRYLPLRSVERSYINLPQLLKYLGEFLQQLYPAEQEPSLIAKLILANLDQMAEGTFGISRATVPDDGGLRMELYSPMGLPALMLGGVAGLLPRGGLTYLLAPPPPAENPK